MATYPPGERVHPPRPTPERQAIAGAFKIRRPPDRPLQRRRLLPWIFMIPLFSINGLVIVGPGIATIYYSLTDWSGIGAAHFIGLANYRKLIQDPAFMNALVHNIWWTLFFLTVPMAMGLLGAFLISRVRRFQLLFRLAYFIPYTFATVVVAAIWENLLAPDSGVGAFLAKVGIPILADMNFLGNPRSALVSVAFVNNWQWWGFLVVVFLAAMQGVNTSLYEAARIDGANAWREFWHVTLPGIRPTLTFMGLMTIIWSFLVFDYVFILTQGGPAGATDVLGTLLYREAFSKMNAGYAAAIGVVMGCLGFFVVSAYLYLRRRKGWNV